MDTVIVARVPDIATATALHEMLDAAGIDADMAGGSDTVFPGAIVGAYAIVVGADDAERARALIDEMAAEAASGELVEDAETAEAAGERDGRPAAED